MANEHTIRVSARGEFGQLETGLKNLQKDLKSVLGEIDKGARRGGLFDDTQLRALDVYRSRFKSSMDEVNREMQKQNDTIEQLHRRRQNSSKSEQQAIDDEIRRREKALDVLRRQIRAVEDLNSKRNKEASTYGRTPSAGGSSEGSVSGASSGSGLFGGAMAKVLGMGKFMVGLAGIGGIASMAQQAYGLAYQSQTTPMNLSQRIRGHGYTGSAKNMWDEIGGIGRNNSMGYTSQESWQFQDQYSRQAGALGANGLEHGLLFGRAYGLEVGETAGSLGANRQLGGASSSQEFANMIAASVGSSGMTPRILEVMETSNGLLEQMNTSLKDGGSKQILAYQTTLDKIGNDKGMMRLTGQQGANVISGLGGIFNPGQDNPWKWMGIQALQQYKPGKYGKMGLYDLETNFESGLENTDNIAAMGSYLKGKSGGDENTMKRMLQKWLQDGGYNATKQQVNDLYSATDGFTAFDSGKINSVVGKMEKGDGTAKYQERMGQLGQSILDTNARFEKQLENLGQPILSVVQGIKEGVTSLLEELQNDGIEGILAGIKKFMDDNLTPALIGAGVAAAFLANKLLGGGGGGGNGGGTNSNGAPKKIPSVLPLVGRGGLSTLLTGAATIFAGKQLFDVFSPESKKKHASLAKKGGYKGDISWFDRFIGESVEAMGGDASKFYGLFSDEKKEQVTKKMDKFFDSVFPTAPKSKEEKQKLKEAADIGNKKMQWYELFNPSKWGMSKPDIFGDTTPAKELAKKQFGYKDPDKAVDSLVKLGDTGLLNISGMTEAGKARLQELSEKGVLKISEGQAVSTATISGFTDKGREYLKQMSDSGAISISGFSADGKAKITALSNVGVGQLKWLKDNGYIEISAFKKESTLKITDLSRDGAKDLLKLQKNGSLSLDGMDKTTDKELGTMRKDTKTKLGDMEKEHKEFKDKSVGKDGIFAKMSDGFKSLTEGFFGWWKDNLPSWLGGGSSDGGNSGGGGLSSGSFVGGKGRALDKRTIAYKDELAAAGRKYGIGDTALLMAIMNQESHGGGNNPMQVNGVHNKKDSVNKGVAYFAKVLKKAKGDVPLALQAYNMGEGYIDYVNKNGGKHTKGLAERFSAIQKARHGYRIYGDTDYVNHVLQYYPEMAVGGGGGGNKGWFFNGWQNRVTSHFGSKEGFRSKPHGGLDINGNQGDKLQALRSGKIVFMNMDDGGKYDVDKKKNTRAGGTEIGVKMADGKTYTYSHLSAVNQDLLKAFKLGKSISVETGDYLGNVGGDPGKAGSGNSTTGSHLHLGLLDKNGNRIDPESWLKGMNAGDSDIGTNPLDPYGTGANGVVSGSTVKKVEVEVTLKGEVEKLNGQSEAALTSMIQKVIQNYEAQKLLLNPAR